MDTSSTPYRGFLLFLGVSSMVGLFSSFVQIQKAYAIMGALFIPMLASVLLIVNGRGDLVGEEHSNRPGTQLVLVAVLILFLSFGIMELGPWK